jgi:alkylation response protein AidB-like acyl-CoA dehydrogenase
MLMEKLQQERLCIGISSVASCRRALEDTVAYVQQRHAFGQPIAEFQAVQLKLADMATSVQAARLMTYWAATKLDSGERADVETGMAKLFASETAVTCALDSMRLHGAYGYSTELDIERLYRDAPLMAIGEGTNDILRTVIARGLSRQIDD